MINKKEEQYLILIDLDGTTLNKDYRTFNALNKKVIEKLKAEGHKICIVTGKNYLSAIPFYNELNLDTYLATYNGAFIFNPKNDKNEKFFSPISNSIFRSIMENKSLKDSLKACLIDTTDNETISTSENVYWKEVFFNNNPYVCGDVTEHLGDRDVLQMVLEFPSEDKNKINTVISALRKYRSAISFNFINKLKKGEGEQLVPDKDSTVIRIRSSFANKGIAAEWISAYYNIPLSRTLAFGDDKNDLEMIRKVEFGIAMANGTLDLKSLSHEVTELDNHSGGVGQHLIKFFNLEDDFKA